NYQPRHAAATVPQVAPMLVTIDRLRKAEAERDIWKARAERYRADLDQQADFDAKLIDRAHRAHTLEVLEVLAQAFGEKEYQSAARIVSATADLFRDNPNDDDPDAWRERWRR